MDSLIRSNRQSQVLNNVQEEEKKLSAVSSYMSIGNNKLSHLEDKDNEIQAPVMQKLAQVPVNNRAVLSFDEQIREAHREAGISIGSNRVKKNNRMSHCVNKERNRQAFLTGRDELRAHVRQMTGGFSDQTLHLDDLEKIEPVFLFYGQSGGSSDEKLMDPKFYESIMQLIPALEIYQRQLDHEKGELKNFPDERRLAKLQKYEARLMTLKDICAHFQVHEALIENRYYSLLPREQMQELSYSELKERLNALYSKPEGEQNPELIDYYQNLIRLKNIGITNLNFVTARQNDYLRELRDQEKKRDPKKEMKKIGQAYSALKAMIDSEDSILTNAQKEERYNQFFRINEPDLKAFEQFNDVNTEVHEMMNAYYLYRDRIKTHVPVNQASVLTGVDSEAAGEAKVEQRTNPSEGIVLTDEQKEGMRLVQAWLLRHSADRRKIFKWKRIDETAFVYRLLEMPPEQQLMVFYLVENEREGTGVSADFYPALANYTPDVSAFKENLKEDRWKKLSAATQKAMKAGNNIKLYGKLSLSIESADRKVRENRDEDSNRPEELTKLQKKKDLAKAAACHGAMLQMLYRSAGISLKMPPDMVENPTLRERMYKEFQTIGALFQEILDLGKEQQADSALKPEYHRAGQPGQADEDKSIAPEEDEEWNADGVVEDAENITEIAGYILEEDDVMTALGEVAPEMTGTMTYGVLSYLAGTVFSTISMLCSAYGLIRGLAKESGLTTADRIGNVTESVSDIANGFGSATWGISSFLEVLDEGEAGEEAVGVWLGEASKSLWNQIGEAGFDAMGVSDQILFVSGVAIAGAGLVKTVSSGIKMGQAISSGHDVKRSKHKLEQREGEANENGRELTEDEKRLKSFLKHQETAVGRQKTSAGVGIATGILTIATGVFLSSGFLAPLGGITGFITAGIDIFYGKIWSKKKRHENRKQMVDDFLNMDAVLEGLKHHPDWDRKLKNMSRDKLKKLVRKEAVAELGFANYKELFRHVCELQCSMLYRKVFLEKDQLDEDEWKMYYDAMASLGAKIVEPENEFDKPEPSIAVMVSKMMG